MSMQISLGTLEGAIRGVEQDVADLVGDLWPHAYRAAIALTGNATLAEDAAQNACYLCVSRIRQLRDPDGFRPWFYRIVHRCARAELRRARRFFELDVTRIVDRSGPLVDLVDLQIALRRIKPQQRDALIVTAILGFTSDEAGAILGAPAATIRHRAFKARAKLAQLLTEPAAALALREEPTHA